MGEQVMGEPDKSFAANAYQRKARSTAVYPDMGSNIYYPALGLAGESAEVLEKCLCGAHPRDLARELGDVLWYVSQLALELGLPMDVLSGDAHAYGTSRQAGPQDTSAMVALGTDIVLLAGKVAARVKKIMRDTAGVVSDEQEQLMAGYLATIVGALAEMATMAGLSLAEVAEMNLDKLGRRAALGVVRGDGDDREGGFRSSGPS